MKYPQYANLLRLNSVENQIIAIARNRPKPHAEFLFSGWRPERHALLRHFAALDALLNDFSPDARGSCGILGLNVVFDLVQVICLCHDLTISATGSTYSHSTPSAKRLYAFFDRSRT